MGGGVLRVVHFPVVRTKGLLACWPACELVWSFVLGSGWSQCSESCALAHFVLPADEALQQLWRCDLAALRCLQFSALTSAHPSYRCLECLDRWVGAVVLKADPAVLTL